MDSMKKKLWIIVWGVVACVASFAVFNDYWISKKKAEMYKIAENCYFINDVKYPSYSQLKYIALNELSFDEAEKIVSVCGLTKQSSSSSSVSYHGSCGNISLQIINRANSDDLIRYTYLLRTNNKEYIRMLMSEIMGENSTKETANYAEGVIDDYWWVGLNVSDDMSTIFYQRFQSKKLPSRE